MPPIYADASTPFAAQPPALVTCPGCGALVAQDNTEFHDRIGDPLPEEE